MPTLPNPVHVLLLLLFNSILPTALAVTCRNPAGRPTPLPEDCTELVDALIASSRFPSQCTPKAWARGLPSTALTEHLPKLYWITGRPHGPTTCGVQLDVDPREPQAVETFGLIDVAYAAKGVLELCLLGRGMVGMERLGQGRMVVAKLVRVDKGGLLGFGGGAGDVQRVGVVGGTVLWSSGLNLTRSWKSQV